MNTQPSPSWPISDTLSVATINLLLAVARHQGADADALARAVGLTPVQLTDPDARVPITLVHRLWPLLIDATGDPHLPLKVGELINPMAVGALAYVMMHSPTLGRALEKLQQYQDIACEGIRTVGRREDGVFRLELHLTSPDITYPEYALNSELSVYLAAIRALVGRPFTPQRVEFQYPEPADISEHQRVFAPAVLAFSQPVTALIFAAEWADAPVLNANPGLLTMMERHAEVLLRSLSSQQNVAPRVKAEIVHLLKGEEPTLPAVADRLAMGVRTLQGQLRAEGATYRQLLDDARRELAEQHLREPFLSLTDIAYLLGYAEPSVFFRQFRKWTGQTPGTFRHTQPGLPNRAGGSAARPAGALA